MITNYLTGIYRGKVSNNLGSGFIKSVTK